MDERRKEEIEKYQEAVRKYFREDRDFTCGSLWVVFVSAFVVFVLSALLTQPWPRRGTGGGYGASMWGPLVTTIRVRRSAVASILGLLIATLSACSSKTAPASVQDGAPGGRDGGTGNLPDTTTDLLPADLPSADLPSATNGCARTLVVCNGLCLAQGQVAGNCTALLGNDTPPTTMAVTGTRLYYAVVGDSAVLACAHRGRRRRDCHLGVEHGR